MWYRNRYTDIKLIKDYLCRSLQWIVLLLLHALQKSSLLVDRCPVLHGLSGRLFQGRGLLGFSHLWALRASANQGIRCQDRLNFWLLTHLWKLPFWKDVSVHNTSNTFENSLAQQHPWMVLSSPNNQCALFRYTKMCQNSFSVNSSNESLTSSHICTRRSK